MTLGLSLGIEHIVHHKIEARGEVRHIAAEGLVRIDRYLQATEVYAIVRLKEFLNVCVLIPFHFFRWEALGLEVLKSLIAHSIHHLWSMRENHLTRLFVELYVLLLTCHYSSPISSLIQS